MRLADIKVGERYAAVRYYDRSAHAYLDSRRLERREYDSLWTNRGAVEVLEVRVNVPGRARPGVRVHWLDRQTMQRQDGGEECIQAVKVLLPWDEWDHRYHEFVEQEQEQERKRVEQAARRRAEERERNARRWMERAFGNARRDLEQCYEILAGRQLSPLLPSPLISEAQVRRLVDVRYPDGNPYLNDEDV